MMTVLHNRTSSDIRLLGIGLYASKARSEAKIITFTSPPCLSHFLSIFFLRAKGVTGIRDLNQEALRRKAACS
ncbi:hypothetical protein PRIPAC_89013, partial [Pristionchus pacificus]